MLVRMASAWLLRRHNTERTTNRDEVNGRTRHARFEQHVHQWQHLLPEKPRRNGVNVPESVSMAMLVKFACQISASG